MEYSVIICSNVNLERMEVEIQGGPVGQQKKEIALVFETQVGWEVDFADDPCMEAEPDEPTPGFDAAVERAQEILGEYPNRNGDAPPDGLTAAGYAAWLMTRDDDSAD